jgi:NAD(P)-dependent dehydrogenase (short-subunit alcohol dehydrogenase family)
MNLGGAVAIVTGSATGVGAACVKRLAAKGARVVINYTRSKQEALETSQACEMHGVETLLCEANIADDLDCRRIADSALKKWGRIDALVNNAATTVPSDPFDLDTLSAADFRHVLGVNVIGTYQMVRAVLPAMKQADRGAIVNISSNVSATGGGSSIAYTASKGAVDAMGRVLARTLGPTIRVNTVCPGVIDTRWMRNALGVEGYHALERRFTDSAPLGRVATANDVAEVAVWLIEGAEFITGETIFVDGGIRLAGGSRKKSGGNLS